MNDSSARLKLPVALIIVSALVCCFMLMSTSLCHALTPDRMTWQNPLPQGDRYNSVAASGPHDIWAAGVTGTMVHYNGSYWCVEDTGIGPDFQGVAATSPTDVWAVTDTGLAAHFDGTTWSSTQVTTSPDPLYGVSASSASDIWAVGCQSAWFPGYGIIAHSTGGSTPVWTVDTATTASVLRAVHARAPDDVWAVGHDGTVLHYTGSWATVPPPTTDVMLSVCAIAPGSVYVGDINGNVHHFDGASWTSTTSGTGNALVSMSVRAPDDGWAVSHNGTIVRLDGSGWHLVTPSPTTLDLYGVTSIAASDVWVVGADGTMLHFNGAGWSEASSGSRMQINGVHAVAPDDVWVAGGGGTLNRRLVRHYNGISWEDPVILTPEEEDVLTSIFAIAPDDVWAVGTGDKSFHFDGNEWSPVTPVPSYLSSVSASGPDDVWASGLGGTVCHNTGAGWVIGTPTTYALYGICAITPSNVYAVGNQGTVLHYDGGDFTDPATWHLEASGLTSSLLYSVSASDANDVWAVGMSGAVLHYNGTWHVEPSVPTADHIYSVSAQASTNVWLAGWAGQICHFDGTSWSTAMNNWYQRPRCVSACDDRHAWVVGEYGTIMFFGPGNVGGCSPASGSRGSTVDVSITGTNTHFVRGESAVTFSGTGITVNSTTVHDATHATANITIAPDAPMSARTVGITAGDRSPDALPGGFTVSIGPPPTVTAVSPSSGIRGEEVSITNLAGTGFISTPTVKLERSGETPITATNVTRVISTKLTCKFALPGDAAVGAWNLVVQNPDGQSATKNNAFTVLSGAPVIGNVTPEFGGTGTLVTITGTGFGNTHTGADRGAATNESYVSFGGVKATEYPKWTDTEIRTVVPDGGQSGSVSVVTANGNSNTDKTFAVTVPTWYLAEGSTDYGFDEYVTIENPNATAVTVNMTYMTPSGAVAGPSFAMFPASQATVYPAEQLGAEDFSTMVECAEGRTIAVDRTMFWQSPEAPSAEGHSSVGVTSPAETWYLPEGSSNWGFETWTLVQNPNNTPADVTFTYMIEGEGPRDVVHQVPSNGRESFSMAGDIGSKDASIRVTGTLPVIAERSMYRNARREGHCSIGTTTPANDYFLAEGTSAWGFTTFVLVQNPNTIPVDVTLTYMTAGGAVPQAPFTMQPGTRQTVRVNPVLPEIDFSTQVHGSAPVIAERAMYWGEGTALGEACHDSIGMPAAHAFFYLPDGQTSGGRETYTLVQNPNPAAVDIEITYMTPTGENNVTVTDTLDANSRETYSMVSSVPDGRAAIVVTSKTPGGNIMVERAMYWNSRGVGTDTIGGFKD